MSNTEIANLLSIANLFQCCHDDIEALAAVYSAPGEAVSKGLKIGKGNEELEQFKLWDEEVSSDAEKCKGQLRRLQLWDEEVRASSGELDHVLRCNPELQSEVVNLLGQLIEAVEIGEFFVIVYYWVN